jgi:hypothetical protein
MAFFSLPAPFFRSTATEFDEAAGFPSAHPLTPNFSLGQYTVGTLSGVDDSQLAPLATVCEKLIQQDFAGGEYDTSRTVAAANGRPAISVTLTVVGGVPTAIAVGAQSAFTIGEGASLAAAIRAIPGHGVQWVPS